MSQLEFTDAEWSSLAAEFCKGFSKEQADVCRTFCRVRGLMPGKHVVFSLRRSSEWDEDTRAKISVSKLVFITTIDAARLIALRSNEYDGQDPETYIYLDEKGLPSIESQTPLPRLPLPPAGQTPLPREPWAVRTTVYRKSFNRPIISVARFDAYASTFKTTNGPQLTEMWSRRPAEQLAKCCEMLGLRKGFPEELSNLFLDLEIKNEAAEEKPTPVTPASVVPLPPPVPAVNQTPAQGTEAPRPNDVPFDKAAMAKVEALVSNPVILAKLAEEGKKVNQEVLEELRAKVAAQENPPTEEPKKRTRKAKPEETVPEKPVDGGITDEDLKSMDSPPLPPVDEEAAKKDAEAFVESVDPTPTKEEQHGFTTRVRALSAAGAKSEDLKNYILNVGKKSDTKQLTIRDWKQALDQLEAAQADGKLVEVSKAAPLPSF